MALEDLTGTKYIDSLNSSNPTATDGVSEGDDHLRGIKNVLKTTFPNVSGAVTATHTELNLIDGVTATTAELNELDASAAAVADFTAGVRTYYYSGDATTATFTAGSSITEGAYESVGPTGSGATNIWTALDVLPSTAKMVIITVFGGVTPSSASTPAGWNLYARKTGATLDTYPAIQDVWRIGGATSEFGYARQFVVPLDSSLRFDFKFNLVNESANSGPSLKLAGFIV